MRIAPPLLLMLAALPAAAAEPVRICYNYGCLSESTVTFSERQMGRVRAILSGARDAAAERAALSLAIGRLYAFAGEQTPIWRDRRGDYADDEIDGRMDCIDHAESTTALLRAIERRGWLRFHRVAEPSRRVRFVIFQHFSAVIEEKTPPAAAGAAPAEPPAPSRWAVDSWFVDHGEPAIVLPLDEWLDGAGPNV